MNAAVEKISAFALVQTIYWAVAKEVGWYVVLQSLYTAWWRRATLLILELDVDSTVFVIWWVVDRCCPSTWVREANFKCEWGQIFWRWGPLSSGYCGTAFYHTSWVHEHVRARTCCAVSVSIWCSVAISIPIVFCKVFNAILFRLDDAVPALCRPWVTELCFLVTYHYWCLVKASSCQDG